MITIETKDGERQIREENIELILHLNLLSHYDEVQIFFKTGGWVAAKSSMSDMIKTLKDKGLFLRRETDAFDNVRFRVSTTPFIEDEENVPRGTMDSENRVEHPNYYKLSNGIEVLDIVRDLPFNIGNVVKYVIRAGKKKEAGLSDNQKQIEDLEKAKFYLEDAIKQLKDNNK